MNNQPCKTTRVISVYSVRTRFTFLRLAWLQGLLMLAISSVSYGTSVQMMSLDQMLNMSSLVVEGRVLDVTSAVDNQASNLIYTLVTVEVIDVIKGKHEPSTISLRFLGGESGGRGMRVHAMVYPEIGEQGVYFIENPTRQQVHPLIGWSQGHLLLKPDSAGIRRVHSNQGRPIMAIEPAGQQSDKGLSRGIARQLLFDQAATASQALTAEEFKSSLRSRLAGPQ